MKPVKRKAKRDPLPSQLDQAIETVMNNREAPIPRVSSRIAALLRVAADLRDLPKGEFRARLREELASRAQSASAPGVAVRAKEVKPIPEGFHSITPYLLAEGAGRLIDFLKLAFGAEEIFRVPRGDRIAHAQLRIEDSMVEVADAIDKYTANPTAIWLFVGDADAVYERALEAGATSIHEPTDQDYGDREASIKDPFGNHWYIATHRADAEPLPPGMHSVTPYLHPIGAPKVIDFLKHAFGAQEVFRAQDPAGTVHHAKIRIGDSIIAMGEAHGPYQPMPPALHLYVSDTDAAYKRALEAGAISIDEPADQDYGDRYAGVKDPFGNVWYIATHKKDFTIPEQQTRAPELPPHRRPGAIMPFMYVDDAAGAFELYRKVFGATELHRITLPDGKVSHVEMAIGPTHLMLRDAAVPHPVRERPRGRRGRTEQVAETKFHASPKTLGRTSLPLYLYVDDADATFSRALAEGSTIVDPLEDKPWGDRCGAVQDPFGHVWFIATPLKNASH